MRHTKLEMNLGTDIYFDTFLKQQNTVVFICRGINLNLEQIVVSH